MGDYVAVLYTVLNATLVVSIGCCVFFFVGTRAALPKDELLRA